MSELIGFGTPPQRGQQVKRLNEPEHYTVIAWITGALGMHLFIVRDSDGDYVAVTPTDNPEVWEEVETSVY